MIYLSYVTLNIPLEIKTFVVIKILVNIQYSMVDNFLIIIVVAYTCIKQTVYSHDV